MTEPHLYVKSFKQSSYLHAFLTSYEHCLEPLVLMYSAHMKSDWNRHCMASTLHVAARQTECIPLNKRHKVPDTLTGSTIKNGGLCLL